MQLKILLKRILLIIVLAGLALFLIFTFYFNIKYLIQSVSAPFVKNIVVPLKQEQASLPVSQASAGVPVRLKIPGINIDATIESVGLTSAGAMDVPKDSADVAWYKLGQRPGENGSAVMAGHYGLKNGKTSVFDNLYKLLPGDKLYVEDDKGKIISFIVRESRSYDPNADASAVFGSNDGKPHLNLVTCEGVWNKDLKSYPKRLVVFTDKE